MPKHYWDHDIFAYITATDNPDKGEDTTTFRPHELAIGDTVFYSKGFAILENLESHKNIPGAGMTENDSATVATMKVLAKTGSIYTIKPILINKGGELFGQPDTATAESLIVQLQKVSGRKAELGVKENDAILEYITLKALKFPFINLLWLGTIIMVIGFMMSMVRRAQQAKLKLRKI